MPRRKKVSGVSEEDLKAIANALANVNELIEKNDVPGLLALYTEDAVLLPTNMDAVQGKEAIKRLFEYYFSVYDRWEEKFATLEVVGMGDAVAERGTYIRNFHSEGRKDTERRGKYVFLWKRTPEGWKIHWEIWNAGQPPP